MERRIKKLMQQTIYISETDLSEKIWQTILNRQQKNTRSKVWVFSIISIASSALLIPIIKSILQDTAQSGFYEYISLAFSGGGVLSSSWKEVAGSIADSFPISTVALSFSIICILLFSVRYILREMNRNQLLLSI